MKKYFILVKSNGTLLVIALMSANFFNFVFNAYLGRVLTLEDYGALTLVNTLWFLLSIFINSLATTTNHYMAFHNQEDEENKLLFYKTITKNGFRASLVVTIIWLALTPFMATVFNLSNWYTILAITPIVSLGTLLAIGKGYFQGNMMFGTVAILILSESISKLIYAAIFVLLNLELYVYLSIPLSTLTAFILTYLLAPNKRPKVISKSTDKHVFPLRFYMATVINGLSSASFLSVDILLAKHFLNPRDAGIYSLLSLIGKMIYFFGTILNSLIVTYISRDLGAMRDFKTTFYKIFFVAGILTVGAYLVFGYFGDLVVPILLGNKAISILPYLRQYGLGIAVFTLASIIVSFHLSKRTYIFSYLGLASTLLMAIAILLFHQSIYHFVYGILIVSTIHFLLTMVLHMYLTHWKKVKEQPKAISTVMSHLLKKLPLNVSICLPAYNEGANIGVLLDALLHQKTKLIHINRIIVISSASTDDTEKIVKRFQKKDNRITLLTEETRNGKASAINLFLRNTKDPLVVIQSTDTIPEKDTIEKLCFPFLTDLDIGMTGGAPIPVNDKNTFIGYLVHTWWWFHRNIPRFGEIIAYRNILVNISPQTAVDEAYIQAQFIKMDYKVLQINEAVVYNKGAENLKDMIKQRRRIHNGHSRLKEEESVKVGNFTKSTLWLLLFKYELKSVKHFIWLIGGIFIEVIGLMLAFWDKAISKVNPTVWDTATSTKNLGYIGKKGGRSR